MVETRSGVSTSSPASPSPRRGKRGNSGVSPFLLLGALLLVASLLPPLAPLHFARSVFSSKAFGPKASTFTQALGAAKAVRDQVAAGEVSDAAKEAAKSSLQLVKRFVWPFRNKGSLYDRVRDHATGQATDPAQRLQEAWEALYQSPDTLVLWKTLVHFACAGLAASAVLLLVLHGAWLRDRLHLDLYHRLLQGLFVFGASSTALTLLNRSYLEPTAFASLLTVFGSVAAVAALPLRSARAVRHALPLEPTPRSFRGATYAVLTIFVSVGGLLILLLPKATLEGVFGVHGSAPGRILWQFSATGAHTLVSYALLNLEPIAERHHLNTQASALLNVATLYPGAVFLLWALRAHFLAHLSGPLLPVLVLTWATAAVFAGVNLPANPHTKRYD